MTEATARSQPFLAPFERQASELERRSPEWLAALRRAARARFDETGFPSSRLEAWKNTNVSPIAESQFAPAPVGTFAAADLPPAARLETGGPRLVFVGGHFAAQLSSTAGLPKGVRAGSLTAALAAGAPDALRAALVSRDAAEAGAFTALNGALFADGAYIHVPRGTRLAHPLLVCHVAVPGMADAPPAAHTRTVLIVEESSEACVVETWSAAGTGPYLTNAVADVRVGDDAALTHLRVQLEGEEAFHIADVVSRQGARSRYRSLNVNLGGRLVRHDLHAALDGQGGNCTLDGLYLTRGSQHVDNHTLLEHAQPHCDSRELYKGILTGRSRTVFNGRIVVRRDAQRTDSKQSNPNLLLSDGALAHTRPQLEIYADDVKCTHGATIGRLNEDAVFYLRSRAIPDEVARNLLVNAFAGEILDRVEPESLRQLLAAEVELRLAGAHRRGR